MSARQQPKYAARVPESIQTLDVVETSRLGRLEFFHGMPSDETVRKVYDQLDFSRGVETFWFDRSWKPGDFERVEG
jgi:hypothetical protein